jgi:hypothetical protein
MDRRETQRLGMHFDAWLRASNKNRYGSAIINKERAGSVDDRCGTDRIGENRRESRAISSDQESIRRLMTS